MKTDSIHMDEHAQDAKVAARLLNVYNNCISWREIHAETDLKRFLVTASLAMLSGFQTTNDVLKQVSHTKSHSHARLHGEGQMQKGPVAAVCCTAREPCRTTRRRHLQDQMVLQTACGMVGMLLTTIAWKTVLAKDEIEAIFPQTASAEYIGDMFEFWLGMLELGNSVSVNVRRLGGKP